LSLINTDVEQVQENIEQRLTRLPDESARDAVLRGISRDRRLYRGIQEEFRELEATVAQLQSTVGGRLTDAQSAAAIRTIAELREQLLKLAQSLQVIQVDLRVELIDLQDFDLSIREAVQLGMENRLDLMNVRARVMDARRRVEVAANNLEAVLDVVAEGEARSGDSNRPFDFRGDRSSYRAGLSFVAPLDKVAARNAYRESLIEYQRARRDYMAFEDQLKLQIRDAWRQLDALSRNFESARQAVRFAALQLDQAVEEAAAPVAPGQSRQSGSQGLNLLNALESLLSAQNNLIGIWVDYERNRLNIYRDMGIMEVDARGIWNDEIYQQLVTQADPLNELRQRAIRDETRSGQRRRSGKSDSGRRVDRHRSTRRNGTSLRG
jgi:outer membrane protein TolC